MSGRVIRTIEEFIAAIREDAADWPAEEPRWFRGEPDGPHALLPSLYRLNGAAHENQLLQAFRARAPAFHDVVPERDRTDEWLFLAQHVGLPTRLLDWSEGALIGLHFALKAPRPVVWMLNPLRLNHLASGSPPNVVREFPLPWHRPDRPPVNIAAENVAGAWENDGPGADLPVAVCPPYVHSRLRGQRARFTIQGKLKAGLGSLLSMPSPILKRYDVDLAHRDPLTSELRILGIAESVVFPDLVGLATELKECFLPPAARP